MAINLELTEKGKNFIYSICDSEGLSLLKGDGNNVLPHTNEDYANKNWECKIKNPFNSEQNIVNGNELADALIFWYNKYAKKHEMDANIMIAQAYVDSKFIMWGYNENDSGSGIVRFTLDQIFKLMILLINESDLTTNDRDIITQDLDSPLSSNSYNINAKNLDNLKNNRPKLHQNVINNPEILIKAQFEYMKQIGAKSNYLASSSLFCFKNGIEFASKTYTSTIEKTEKINNKLVKNGVDYVLKTFIILGDKENVIDKFKRGNKSIKPRNIYFGYDFLFNNDQLNYENENFKIFDANIEESKDLGLTEKFETDKVTKILSEYPNYRFIYFPENKYNKGEENKNQKKQIVLHHTVSGSNVGGVVNYWKNKGERIATAFIVSRDGNIYQLFSTNYWAYHLGLKTNNNKYLNERSVGIEINSWGGLLYNDDDGKWYPSKTNGDRELDIINLSAGAIDNDKIVRYNEENNYFYGYHGFTAFEKYTDKQISSVRKIIKAIKKQYPNISTEYKGDKMWGTYNTTTEMWSVDDDALSGEDGIWSHTSFRADKSDIHPQPELIQMLENL